VGRYRTPCISAMSKVFRSYKAHSRLPSPRATRLVQPARLELALLDPQVGRELGDVATRSSASDIDQGRV